MELEEAKKIIEQEREKRAKETIEHVQSYLKEKDCSFYAEVELPILGQIIKIDSRMFAPEVFKLNIIAN